MSRPRASTLRFPALAAAALAAPLAGLLSAGCSSVPSFDLGPAVRTTSLEGLRATFPEPDGEVPPAMNVRIDPDTGNYVMGNHGRPIGGGNLPSVAVVRPGSGEVVSRVETDTRGMLVVALGNGVAMVEQNLEVEGTYAHLLIDLATGETLGPVTGLDATVNAVPPWIDSAGVVDPDGAGAVELASVFMDIDRSSTIDIWGGPVEARTLLRSIPLTRHVGTVHSFAYAPDRGVVFAEISMYMPYETKHRVVAIGLESGDIEAEYFFPGLENTYDFDYDPKTGRLVVLDFDGLVSEYQL